MSTELSILNPKSLSQAKQTLKDWKPTTKEQAGLFLLLRSLIQGKAGEAAKKAAEDYIATKCVECEKHEFDGFTLKLVTKTAKVCKGSPEVSKWETKLVDLQEKLDEVKIRLSAAKELAGYDEAEGSSYWLVQ